jgi:glycosyltransferase involved in cell wall biosynthesis
LECICGQTYRNLEIIVSDNCSPDPAVERVALEFAAKDSRVSYFRQDENKGPSRNFNFVLKKSCGKYFMWAADDDLWHKSFVQRVIDDFGQHPEFSAIITECQYFSDKGNYDFFPEGKSFGSFWSADKYCRLKHVLKYNYGNLLYSIYLREVLFEEDKTAYDVIGNRSLNEIPLFLFVAKRGNWRVIPEVGMYKRTTNDTYIQAKWEICGGKLPNCTAKNLYPAFKYHCLAVIDIFSIIKHLNLHSFERIKFSIYILRFIILHYLALAVGWKPKRSVSGEIPA